MEPQLLPLTRAGKGTNKLQILFSDIQFLLELTARTLYNHLPNSAIYKMNGLKMQKIEKIYEHKSTRLLVTYAIITCALMLTGCARPQYRETVEQICLPDIQKQQAMQTAEDILARMQFTIDKSDAEQGIIRTRPLPAAQSFEFWRSDNIGSFNSTEANLHSIRRTAELGISRQAGQLCISCDVKVQRLSLPERQVTGSGHAYAMFTPSKQSIQVLELHPEQKESMAWVDLGSDKQLATDILKRISSILDTRSSSLDIENRESNIE